MNHIMRLLREPLFHFLIIGTLLFLLYSVVSGPLPEPVNTIVITPERVTQLASGFEAVRKRPATDDELRVLVDSFIREEVYYREALALGLERDDTIIRRRLQQKMEFLTNTGAELLNPQPGELEAYYEANSERFQESPTIALAQVFLGQQPSADRVNDALAVLRSDDQTDPASLGEVTLLPPALRPSTNFEIDGMFGAGFFDGLMQLPVNYWSGPIQSGYGVHLVLVQERSPARIVALDDVRDLAEREWRAEKLQELHGLVYDRLLQRYTVVMPERISAEK